MFSIFSIRSQNENGGCEAFAHVDKSLLECLERVAMKILNNQQDAEDAVMQALLLIGQNASKLADLTADEFRAVSITYTRNVAKTFYKRRKREGERLVEYVEEIHAQADSAEEEPNPLLCEENVALMTRLMDRLPEVVGDALHFRFTMGMKYAEIGRLLNIPEGTARVYCHRGRKLLKKWMEEEGYHGQKK